MSEEIRFWRPSMVVKVVIRHTTGGLKTGGGRGLALSMGLAAAKRWVGGHGHRQGMG
jgi:hypothetical protein